LPYNEAPNLQGVQTTENKSELLWHNCDPFSTANMSKYRLCGRALLFSG